MVFTEREAYHEAGHAVMAELYGASVGTIQISMSHINKGGALTIIPELLKLSVNQQAQIRLAGNVAQGIYKGELVEDYGCSDDFQSLEGIMSVAEIADLWWKVHAKLVERWSIVDRLALSLINHRRLSGKRLSSILKGVRSQNG